MRQVVHMSTSIDGLLALNDRELGRIVPHMQVDGVRLRTAEQARHFLNEAKQQGWRLIQAEGCKNFDPVKGCMCCGVPDAGDFDDIDMEGIVASFRMQVMSLISIWKGQKNE